MLQNQHTEQVAFEALASGDEKGLEFFFNRHYTPLVFYSASITSNREVAAEIVSEAFLKLWMGRQNIGQLSKIKNRLYNIVRNASIDHFRKQKTIAAGRALYMTETTEGNILDRLVETETYHKIYSLLATLPPKCRQIFQMFYLQDKAVKQIAEELGISVNTVKSQKQRALQLLEKSRHTIFLLWASLLFWAVR